MENEIKSRWGEIIAYLKDNSSISGPAIRTFIEPLEAISYENNILTLQIDMSQQGDCYKALTERYYFDIRVAVESIIEGEEIAQINFVYKKDDSVSSYFNEEKEQSLIDKYPYLSQGHSFETFVTSQSNAMAYAAALNVAENPTLHVYNPLFLYGNPGLGKTHLMHSIARHIIEHHPELKVLYITSEDFTNQVIEAIRSNKVSHDNSATTNLRKKFRSVDVLLIDDIQFIIGKESSQLEFFNTFETLFQLNKQIVISSDKPPRDMPELDDRYRTRFSSGLLVDIQPPDYETSMAILNNLKEKESIQVDEEVLRFIATNIRSSVRELEGAFKKVQYFSTLSHQKITLELAENALKDMIKPDSAREITVEYIIDIVTDHFQLSSDAIVSKKRQKTIAYPRQICMYLCKELTDLSTTEIGEKIGGRDHSTVIHGCAKIEELINTDPTVKKMIDILIKKINP